MKTVCTSKFNRKDPMMFNKLLINNRRGYVKFNDYKTYWEVKSLNKNVEESWRHPEIIIKTLKNKKFNDCDVIVNTGRNNIVTNFNITIEDKMAIHFNPTKHEMVLQSWYLDPDIVPYVIASKYEGGPLYLKRITEPYPILMGE